MADETVQLTVHYSAEKRDLQVPVSRADLCVDLKLQLFLLLGVAPSRQRLLKGVELSHDSTLTQFYPAHGKRPPKIMLMVKPPSEPGAGLGAKQGMELLQGLQAELEVQTATTAALERVLARAAAPDLSRLHSLACGLEDSTMKLLLTLDSVEGDDNVRTNRKALAKAYNALLERLDGLKDKAKPI